MVARFQYRTQCQRRAERTLAVARKAISTGWVSSATPRDFVDRGIPAGFACPMLAFVPVPAVSRDAMKAESDESEQEAAMTMSAVWRRWGIGALVVLLSGPVLAQTDAASSESDTGRPRKRAISARGDRRRRRQGQFRQGGAQTPLDQRRNAVTFGQMDVDQDGVLSEEEARQAGPTQALPKAR